MGGYYTPVRYNKTCQYCGKEFVAHNKSKVYCSKKCKDIALRIKKGIRCNPNTEPFHKVCTICGKSFDTYREATITCSSECSKERKRQQDNKRHDPRCELSWDEYVAKVKAEAEARNEEKQLAKSRIDLIRHINAYANLKTDKVCACCGAVFHNEYPNAIYCSDKCRRRTHDKRRRKVKPRTSSIRKRCRKYGVYYDPSVTSAKVFERDGYICQICGKPTDSSDTSWGIIGPNAPTVDHIVALANGGTHTWDNVQCAHAICNSYKRDLWADEFEEVLLCLA